MKDSNQNFEMKTPMLKIKMILYGSDGRLDFMENNISGFKIVSIATLHNAAEEEVSNNFTWFQLLLIECL